MNANTILTAAEMRAAEERVITAGTSVESLMERAGTAAAEAIWRYAGPMPALVLCGPGNNGGDGYVIASRLKARGLDVRVAALGDPGSPAARWARGLWDGSVEALEDAAPARLLVDALFGTGLTRPLEERSAGSLSRLAASARVRIAIDLPSGVSTDDGQILSAVPDYDLTVTFGALKPAHLLRPAARHMGRIVVADIGVEAHSDLVRLSRPRLLPPTPDDHKYSRGYVAVIGGEMPGAAALTAAAAARAGAGYVRLIAPEPIPGSPAAVVQGRADPDVVLADGRIGALVVGPGLGRTPEAWEKLVKAAECGAPLILDADALWLIAEMGWGDLPGQSIITTPHAGEFEHMYGDQGSKLEAARSAAMRTGHVIVFKGSDTVVASPDGRAAIGSQAPAWLASAGTGDVLAGIIAARRAAGMAAFEAACAGVWLHAGAARRAGPALIADDLLAQLAPCVAECL